MPSPFSAEDAAAVLAFAERAAARERADDARHLLEDVLRTVEVLVSRFAMGARTGATISLRAGEDALVVADRFRRAARQLAEAARDHGPPELARHTLAAE